MQFDSRVADIRARRARGQNTGIIADALGISARMVRKYLAAAAQDTATAAGGVQ